MSVSSVGKKLGRSSKVKVKAPCSPHEVGELLNDGTEIEVSMWIVDALKRLVPVGSILLVTSPDDETC
jgi:hypothetical protein